MKNGGKEARTTTKRKECSNKRRNRMKLWWKEKYEIDERKKQTEYAKEQEYGQKPKE